MIHKYNTRSTNTTHSDMEISNNLEAYFKSLIEPLATNKDIEGMFIKFKEEIVNEFEENIRCQEEKINRLEGTVNIQANLIKNKIR